MERKLFFPKKSEANPTIYAYADTNPQYAGLLKVGFTTNDAKTRVAQQYPILKPGALPYLILVEEAAIKNDGNYFTDHDVHRALKRVGIERKEGEWFVCEVKHVLAAIQAVKTNSANEENRTADFALRPEQLEAVEKTAAYFTSTKADSADKTPHFLWNAKMRFGKTFAAYKLAQTMGWKKILVLTFKPAVQSAWQDDLNNHIDFEGWQFIYRKGLRYEDADTNKPFVCFASFQDFLGKNEIGGIKLKNEWAHAIHWDCVIFDEYHYGAWREGAKGLFDKKEKDIVKDKYDELEFFGKEEDTFKEDYLPITTNAYLYLSGTPFRAMASGEFIEEQIYNWTYSDEQRAKADWGTIEKNPYAALPQMVMLTYKMPEAITKIAVQGEYNEFDLNVFFSAHGEDYLAKFVYEDEVQKWLDLIRGSYTESVVDNLKLGIEKPPMPFSDVDLLNLLSHTFWFLPNVASCHAMKNLLEQKQNKFYHDYEVVVAAGKSAGIGVEAIPPITKAMGNALKTKTITLSCGKLTTGVSIKPWAGILMLRNLSSPETYFQAAFRVQTPWSIKNTDSTAPNKEEIIKNKCYVFDFAPNRALRQIADYSCRLNVDESNPEKKVAEFIHFLPVLAYDGSSMQQLDAASVLDLAMSGTTATMLARRWESALLVNVDNNTLQRLMNNQQAMDALMKIEGFRSLNETIETIINKSEAVKKAKKEADEKELTDKEKKELTDDEKDFKSKRKQIQENLIKFATRIPVFMYLTDYRETSLFDVITQLEPSLFQKVTGLTLKDFELLVSLDVFNFQLMNDAVWKFKRYEDASLEYVGINKHAGEKIGLANTVISKKEFHGNFVNDNFN